MIIACHPLESFMKIILLKRAVNKSRRISEYLEEYLECAWGLYRTSNIFHKLFSEILIAVFCLTEHCSSVFKINSAFTKPKILLFFIYCQTETVLYFLQYKTLSFRITTGSAFSYPVHH